jgi:hypothetical protein
MTKKMYIASCSALLPNGMYGPRGVVKWADGQAGPQDVRREQVLDKPYPNFGKLMLPDKLAFAAASLILSKVEPAHKETTAITLGISAGSLSTDLRYMESVIAGFPSPAIFSATLPSSAITDIAIYFGLKGPNRVCAGNAASGLAALEMGTMVLKNGKANAALVISVTAVEPQDRSSPLLDPVIGTENRAFAFFLTTTPHASGTGLCLNASFSARDKEVPQAGGEVYFTQLVELILSQKTGTIAAESCTTAATLSIEKED